MSLVPFRLTLESGPVAKARLEPHLTEWVKTTHGPTGQVVRWAIVAGPADGQDGPWQIEGVAGPLPTAE